MSSELRLPFGQLFIFETSEHLALGAAERFVQYSEEAIKDHTFFRVVLSGGRTPRRVYELLASEPFRMRIDWPRVHLFFGDERCVPPDHPASNYRMVNESLISKVPIPQRNVHRIAGEEDPLKAAEDYEAELRALYPGLEWPNFDLVFLGMGEDGHTASLFPGSETLKENSRWVLRTRQEATGQDRISLTAPVFNHAAHVVFLVTGKEKAQRLQELLFHPELSEETPAAMIRPINGTLEWLVEQQAATLLAVDIAQKPENDDEDQNR